MTENTTEDTKQTPHEASNWGTRDSVYSIVVHDLPDRDGYHATEKDADRYVHGATPAEAARNYVVDVAGVETTAEPMEAAADD